MSVLMAEPPSFDDLKNELGKIRQHGITRLRRLDLPAMTEAARACGLIRDNEEGDPPIWETLIREALDDLTATRIGEVGGLLFGLEYGTRGYEPHELRRDAAERWGVSEERFRKDPQTMILSEIAEAILRRCVAYRQRQARFDMERKLPTSSRLAVKWLERFDSYHRIWTPTYALGADLTAYRHTLIEPDRPYDDPLDVRPELPDGYTQEIQAAGYITFALFHYTEMLVELHAFRRRYGGQWLLSDPQAEEEASNAIHTIAIESSNNERDDSYLRHLYTRTSPGSSRG